MVLETIGDPQIHVGSLGSPDILTPEPGKFNPSEDILDSEKKALQDTLEKAQTPSKDKFQLYALLKPLGLAPSPPEVMFNQMKFGLGAIRSRNDRQRPAELGNRLFEFKVLFPDKMKEIHQFPRDAEADFNALAQGFVPTTIWDIPDSGMVLSNIAIVFPEKVSKLRHIEAGKVSILKYLDEKKGQVNYKYIQVLATYRLAFPEDNWEEYITPDVLEKLTKDLHEQALFGEVEDTLEFAVFAFNLGVLSAEEIKISDKGLELTFEKNKPKSIETLNTPMPEERSF